MKINKLLLAITILLLVSVLLTACGNDKSTPTPTPTPTPTATPAATATPTPKPSPEKTLTLGGVPSTSSTHVFFTTLGQVLNDALPEIYFVVKDTLGSQAVMAGLINNGNNTTPTPSPTSSPTTTPTPTATEPTSTPSSTATPTPTPTSTPAPIKYDFGQSLSSVEFMAYAGMSPWTTTNPDLRQLCSWSTQTLIIAVSEDSGIQSLADLKDKNLRVGPTSNISNVATTQILGALDIQPKYDSSTLTNLAADLKDKKIDGFALYIQQGTPDTTITTVQKDVPLKILSFSPEDIQKVTAKYSYMTTGKIEAGAYQNTEEIDSFTIVATLATLKDSLSETEAYRIVKAIWEGKDTLGNAYPSFKDYKLPEETIASSLIPLHAGALKYFKELGLTVPDTLVPPEAKQ